MSKFKVSLSEEDLSKVSGGAKTILSKNEITVLLDHGEDAAEAFKTASFPYGLLLDAASRKLLTETIIPAMGTNGSRMLWAEFTVCMTLVHVTNYTLF